MSSIRLLIVTFNCGRLPINESVFSKQLLEEMSGANKPDLVVFSLQEIAPIALSFLGGPYIAPYLERVQLTIRNCAEEWAGEEYSSILSENIGMTAMTIFARNDIAHQFKIRGSSMIGIGWLGMGNKGAIGARLAYSDSTSASSTEMTFVAAHLPPAEYAVEQRNQGWAKIARTLSFEYYDRGVGEGMSIDAEQSLLSNRQNGKPYRSSGIYTPTSHLFVAGDLNYRTSSLLPAPGDHHSFPSPEAGMDCFSHLLLSDQLASEKSAGKTLQRLLEAPINFPPTYKYSHCYRLRIAACEEGKASPKTRNPSGCEWDERRWPSWCDRILYLDPASWKGEQRNLQVNRYQALPLMSTSDHRPVFLDLTVSCDQPDSVFECNDEMRFSPPYFPEFAWQRERAMTRPMEITVGCAAYLITTREGFVILIIASCFLLAVWLILMQPVLL